MTVTRSTGDDASAGTDGTGEGAEDGDEASERTDGGLSMDDVFHLLQNQRRRDVLRYLERVDGEAELSDLAEQVAAWEHDTTVDALSSKERKRVYVALYQSHLPKLDEMGIIEYDQHRGSLRPTSRADLLGPYLRRPGEDGERDAGGSADSGARSDSAATDGAGAVADAVPGGTGGAGDAAGDGGSGAETSATREAPVDVATAFSLCSAAGFVLALLVGLRAPLFAALSWFHVSAAILVAFTALTALFFRS